MESTVETLSPTRVRIAVEVPFAELEPSVRKAYREIGASVTIPGFRKGKVPSVVIDQRVGRGTVLREAVQDAIPGQFVAAVRQHEVRTLGQPTVEITQMEDGQPLRFVAEVDIRPDIVLPDLSEITVTVDELTVTDDEVDAQVEGLRRRFGKLVPVERSTQMGDFVQIDVRTEVEGTEVPGGSTSNFSYEVGSGALMPGLDEALVGMSAGDSTTITTAMVSGKQAEVSVTVRAVKERELPTLDDTFVQESSEFDTIDELRASYAERIRSAKRFEQLYAVRDRALEAVIAAAGVPAPEGAVKDAAEARREAFEEQMRRIGATTEQLLAEQGKSQDTFEAELTEMAEDGVRTQLVLDAYADAESVGVTEEEFGHEIMHRAKRAGVAPQQYYDQLVRDGAAAVVFADLRRGKALTMILERVTIVDTAGNRLTLEDLQGESAHDDAAGEELAAGDAAHTGEPADGASQAR